MSNHKCSSAHPLEGCRTWGYLFHEFFLPWTFLDFVPTVDNDWPSQGNICIADDGTVQVTDIAMDTLVRQANHRNTLLFHQIGCTNRPKNWSGGTVPCIRMSTRL